MTLKINDGILLKFSVGIGNNINSAEKALMVAKQKKTDSLYNIEINDVASSEAILDKNIESIVSSFLKIKEYLSKNNPPLLKDLENFKYDKKTGLLNRIGYFIEIEDFKLKHDKRCILFFDADNMHDINEKYGYDFVDKYLIVVGKTLEKSIRDKNKKDRFPDVLGYESDSTIFHRKNDSAGDEFIVNIAYDKPDFEFAKKIAKRYLDNIYLAQKELSKELNLF